MAKPSLNDLVDALLQPQQDTEVGHACVQKILWEFGYVYRSAIAAPDGAVDDSKWSKDINDSHEQR